MRLGRLFPCLVRSRPTPPGGFTRGRQQGFIRLPCHLAVVIHNRTSNFPFVEVFGDLREPNGMSIRVDIPGRRTRTSLGFHGRYGPWPCMWTMLRGSGPELFPKRKNAMPPSRSAVEGDKNVSAIYTSIGRGACSVTEFEAELAHS